MQVHAPEPTIDNTPIFGIDSAPTSGASFSCDVAQYAAFRSFYAATGGGGISPFPTPPPVLVGVISANTADGDVVITGANGVAVSSGPTPTISLGDITPSSLVASGTFTGGASATAEAGAALFPTSMSSGSVSVVTPVATISITSPTVSAASINVSTQVSAASAIIAGLVSAGAFAVPGALNIGTITNGSLGFPAPFPFTYESGMESSFTIAGWRICFGTSAPSGTVGAYSNIGVSFAQAFRLGAPCVSIYTVRIGDTSYPFTAESIVAPRSAGFDVRFTANFPINGAQCSWIAIGAA